jgi:DNA polymerase-3 subunit delta
MDLEKVMTDLKEGSVPPPPCFLLYGEEDYLIKDTLNKIIAIIVPEADRDLNLFFMDGEYEDIDVLCDTIMTPPLIPGKKAVVLRNTRLFQSRRVLPEILQKIRHAFEHEPDSAVKYFIQFMRVTGLNLDDLKNDGWKRITDGDWQKIAEGDSGHDRETWLPGIIEACIRRGVEVTEKRDDTERLEDVLKSGIPEGNHLIITAETVDKRKKLFKVISETGLILHFSPVKGEARQKNVLMDAARDLLAKSGKKLSPRAWIAIGKKTGFTLADSMSALETLITYTGERTSIEETDVEEVVGKTKEDTVFDLTGALADKNLQKALSSLKDLFDQGINHLLILSMIAREIRFLLHAKAFIKSGRIAAFHQNMDYDEFHKAVYPVMQALMNDKGKKGNRGDLAAQHPYVIYHALRNSNRFAHEHLVSYLEDLFDMDMAFKTTAREPKFLLERFIVNVCS